MASIRIVSAKSDRRRSAGVGEDKAATGDLQYKSRPEPQVGGSDKTLRRSSQLFWPTKMEYSIEKIAEYREGEENLRKTYLENPFYSPEPVTN